MCFFSLNEFGIYCIDHLYISFLSFFLLDTFYAHLICRFLYIKIGFFLGSLLETLTQTSGNSECFALFKLLRWVMGCGDTGRDSNLKLTTVLSTSTHMFQQRGRLIVKWYVCWLVNIFGVRPCWNFLLSISTWNIIHIFVWWYYLNWVDEWSNFALLSCSPSLQNVQGQIQ